MKAALWICVLAIAAMIGVSVYGWMHIPDNAMLARHWNLNGVADGFSPRNHVLIGMPVFATVIAFFFFMIPAMDPRPDHVRRSAGLLSASAIGVTALLAVTHASLVLPAVNNATSSPLPGATLYAASILLILVGNYTAKSRSNFFLGIRTPWTLSSEHAWSVANRTGGWLFALTGAAAAATGIFINPTDGYLVLGVGAVSAALISIIVSYFAWRSDPERQNP
jgi:immunity protein, SdpI family